jgi:hypothetical protein
VWNAHRKEWDKVPVQIVKMLISNGVKRRDGSFYRANTEDFDYLALLILKTCFIMAAEKKSANRGGENSTLSEAEIERLRRDIYRPDMDKLRLFTQMLRVNALFKKAKVTHK